MSTTKDKHDDIPHPTQTCRLCLSNDSIEYGSIYNQYDGVLIVHTITKCLGVKVHKNDGLTQAVCKVCCDKLVFIDKIRKQCVQSDKTLRDQAKNKQKTAGTPPCVDAEAYNATSAYTYIEEVLLLPEEKVQLQQDFYEVQVLEETLVPLQVKSNDGISITLENIVTPIDTNPSTDFKPANDDAPATGQYTFICCGCPLLKYDSIEKLRAHRDEQHAKYRILDNTIRRFECDTCYQRFLSDRLLQLHKTRPYRTRSHVCKSCGSGYFTRCAIRRHEKVCSIVEKKFACEECGKRFLQAMTLKNHQKLHHAEKPYACPVCEKTFKKKFEISIHMVTHTSEQPYPCDHCPARFKRKQALINHQRHHDNVRPYKCSMCEEWFNSFTARKYHRQTVHEGQDPFRCEQCGASYGRRLRLKKHMQNAHGIDLIKSKKDDVDTSIVGLTYD